MVISYRISACTLHCQQKFVSIPKKKQQLTFTVGKVSVVVRKSWGDARSRLIVEAERRRWRQVSWGGPRGRFVTLDWLRYGIFLNVTEI